NQGVLEECAAQEEPGAGGFRAGPEEGAGFYFGDHRLGWTSGPSKPVTLLLFTYQMLSTFNTGKKNACSTIRAFICFNTGMGSFAREALIQSPVRTESCQPPGPMLLKIDFGAMCAL